MAKLSLPSPNILERVVFRRVLQRGGRSILSYVVADAYDGARIREAILDALEFTAGRGAQEISVGDASFRAGGAAALIAYVGHDGLMDFQIPAPAPGAASTPPRAAVFLACISGTYFGEHLKRTGALPLLMTTGLMAPEAYTLNAALERWFGGDSAAMVRETAAVTYDRYQHCGLRGARRLFGAATPGSP